MLYTNLDTKWLIWEGILLTLLGLLAIILPYMFTLGLTITLGALLLIGGIGLFWHTFKTPEILHRGLSYALALLYFLVGLIMLTHPVLGSMSLTLLVAAFFILDGVSKIALAIKSRHSEGWMWLLLSGILSLVLAGLIIAGWPQTGLWAIGLLFGINLIFTGAALFSLGMYAKKI